MSLINGKKTKKIAQESFRYHHNIIKKQYTDTIVQYKKNQPVGKFAKYRLPNRIPS